MKSHDTTEVGDDTVTHSCDALTPMRGRGKELCDLLRRDLKIPEGARSFTVRFAHDDVISVTCDYIPRAD